MDPDHPRDPAGVRVEPAEAAVIQDLFARYDEPSVSLFALTRHVQALGVVTPRGGSRWNPATIRGLLTNPVYTGPVYAGRIRSAVPQIRRSATHPIGHPSGSAKTLPPEDWIPVAMVPVLIGPEQFARVQAKLAQNQSFARRNNHAHDYLLRALVSCGVCQYSGQGRWSPPDYAYYLCRTKIKPRWTRRDQRCPARYIPADALDALVWADLCELLAHPESIAYALERARGGHWLPQELQARREQLRRGQVHLEGQIERLTQAYLAAVIALSEYQRRRQALEQNLQALATQAQPLDAQANHQAELAGLTTSITAFCQRVRTGLTHATFEQKRTLVELLIDRVVVTNDEVEIRYVIPTSPAGEHTRFCHLRKDYFDEGCDPVGGIQGGRLTGQNVVAQGAQDLRQVAEQNLGGGVFLARAVGVGHRHQGVGGGALGVEVVESLARWGRVRGIGHGCGRAVRVRWAARAWRQTTAVTHGGHRVAGPPFDRSSPHEAIPQDADALDFQFDHITGLEGATEFQAAAGADGAGADDLAGVQGFGLGNEGNDILEPVVHRARRATAPHLAVHPGGHGELIGIPDFVGRDDPGTEHITGIEVFALGRTELAGHLLELGVAGGAVIEDGEPENMGRRRRARDVHAGAAEDTGQFQLEVHHLGIRGPAHLLVGADHREAIGFVVERSFVPDRRDGIRPPGQLFGLRKGIFQVLLEHQAITNLARLRQRRQPPRRARGIESRGRGRREIGACQRQRRRAAVDQRQHIDEIGADRAGYRLVGGGEIEQRSALVQHGPDAATALYLNSGQLHKAASSRIATARVHQRTPLES